METGLAAEQLRMFVEIVQMVALLDEAMQKYLAEFYSLCNDEKEILEIQKNIQGLESTCKEISKIFKKNIALNKPKIEKMTEKYHDIKEIRNYIAHDRNIFVMTASENNFKNFELDELLKKEKTEIQEKTIEENYRDACNIFNEFKTFLGLLYFDPNEEEYQAERRLNLYGK